LCKKSGECVNVNEEADETCGEEGVPEEEAGSVCEPFIFTACDDESAAENYEYGDEYSPYDSV